MSTNPFDMDDLLGAYALDAVTDEERRAVEDYLASSPRAAAEVQEHREVATMLAWSGMDAPDGLWDRIAGHLEGSETAPESDLGRVLPLAKPRRRRLARTVGAWAAGTAAAAAIAVFAVRADNGNDDGGSASGLDRAVKEAFADPASKQADLVSAGDATVKVRAVVDSTGHGYLLADSLPALPDKQTYQLWGKVGDQLISLGLLGSHPRTAVFTAGSDVSLLALTAEVEGGVLSSKNPPVAAGELSA